MSVLDEIVAHKRREVAAARRRRAPEEVSAAAAAAAPPRGFRQALLAADRPAIVAEIKRRSPSRGEIRPDFDPLDCARQYARGGAAALSVLTDEKYFGGDLGFLAAIRREVSLPLLRKDFVVDAYQIDEARAAGADAVLLIVGAVAPAALRELGTRAAALGLDALVEVHDEAQLELALDAEADLVGINNRDLRSFEVDLGTTERLAPRVPENVLVVAESGIFTHDHVRRLGEAGAGAFLVGEALMGEADLVSALRKLRGSG